MTNKVTSAQRTYRHVRMGSLDISLMDILSVLHFVLLAPRERSLAANLAENILQNECSPLSRRRWGKNGPLLSALAFKWPESQWRDDSTKGFRWTNAAYLSICHCLDTAKYVFAGGSLRGFWAFIVLKNIAWYSLCVHNTCIMLSHMILWSHDTHTSFS